MLSNAEKKKIVWDDDIDRSKIEWDKSIDHGFVPGGTGGVMTGHSKIKEESPPVPKPESFGEFVEPIMSFGSALLAEPIAGVAGIIQGAKPWTGQNAAEKAVNATREAMTYKPKGANSQAIMSEIASVAEPIIKPIGKAFQYAGDKTYDITGSPTAATAVVTAPAALAEYLGVKGIKFLKPGTRLHVNGEPVGTFKKLLDKAGLDYHSLDPNVKARIPEIIPAKNIPGGKPIKAEVNKITTEQIKAGGTQSSLHKYKLNPEGTSVKDPIGVNAVKQGFSGGFVQSIKVTNRETKNLMTKMLRMRRAISKDPSLRLRVRPSDIAGESVSKRLKFLNDTINREGRMLDIIAKRRLRGKSIDPSKTIIALERGLKKLKVKLDKSTLQLDFDGSAIAKDPTSQRAIQDVVDLLSYGGKPDALRFHELKQQLDTMIDYRKKSPHGLTDAGQRVVYDVRKALNDSLRKMNDDYAKVNDRLSLAYDKIDEIDKATGSVAIFGDVSPRAIGTKLRGVLSNNNNSALLTNALDEIDRAVTELGGKFNDDMLKLVEFDSEMNRRFGTVADNSFAGQIEEANRHSFPTSKTGAAIHVAGKVATKTLNKVRGVNEYEAYEAMEKLLKQ